MKRIALKKWSLFLAAALLLSLLGCAVQGPETLPSTLSTDPQPTQTQITDTQTTEPQPTDPQATEPQPTEPQPTEPKPTEPQPTEPQATEPQPTDPAPTEPQPTDPPAPTDPPVAQGRLEVHFIDVGQADAALLLCNGKAMLIDGGNAGDSNLIYAYLKRLNIQYLDYIVATHAHEDHVGGLSGALNYATVGTAYAPVTSYSTKAFGNFVKYLGNQNVSITVPSVGTSFSLGGADCKVLAVNTASDPNNTSIVLRVTYGSTSFLFTGDAERETENYLVNSGQTLKSTVLKVGHHGSDTSTSYLFLRSVMPEYAVISVGKGNSYGHPTDNVLSRLRDADTTLYRTDMHGDVICYSNGSAVSFYTGKTPTGDVFGGIGNNSTAKPTDPPPTQPSEQPTQPAPTEPQPTEPAQQPDTASYVVNTNSRKFHEPDCQHAGRISEKNRWDYTGTREELIEQGYAPCKVCNP